MCGVLFRSLYKHCICITHTTPFFFLQFLSCPPPKFMFSSLIITTISICTYSNNNVHIFYRIHLVSLYFWFGICRNLSLSQQTWTTYSFSSRGGISMWNFPAQVGCSYTGLVQAIILLTFYDFSYRVQGALSNNKNLRFF